MVMRKEILNRLVSGVFQNESNHQIVQKFHVVFSGCWFKVAFAYTAVVGQESVG